MELTFCHSGYTGPLREEATQQFAFRLQRDVRLKSPLNLGPVFCGQGYSRGGEGVSLWGAGERLTAFSNSAVIDNRLCEESPAQPG